MKYYFTFFLFLSINTIVFSQTHLVDVTNPQILELVDNANKCSDNRLENCDKIYQEAISLGEKNNESFVDYLYYVLARHKMKKGNMRML